MYLLTLVLLAVGCLPSALLDFALPIWKADAALRIEDAYKWTYQATRGGEHAVPDADSARKWLEDEWNSLGVAGENELLVASLCPGGEIVRLNLRPYRQRGGKRGDLLDAFLASSRDYGSEGANFLAAWTELGKRLKKNPVGALDYKAWEKLGAEMKSKDYPAIHHSESYENARQPAYRILTKAEMEKIVPR